MRILNIAMGANFTEGYSYQDNLLSEYQHKLGHTVAVLTGLTTWNECGQKIQTFPCDIVMDNGVRLIRIKSGNKIINAVGYYPQINKILTNYKPDLIFIHGLCNFIPIQAIKYKIKYPQTILVADNHQDKDNFNFKKFPFFLMVKLWRIGWTRWSKYFNYIYGTTSWRKDFAIYCFGIPENKADVLPLGVDTDNLCKDAFKVRCEIRKQLNIDRDAFVFIHGGKMNSDKRTIDIIESFSRIRDNNIRLILFGSVAENIRNQFDNLLEKDQRIVYVGYVKSKTVHKYFYASDFSLFPGLHSVLWEEAIGCGLPGLYQSFSSCDHTNMYGNSILIKADTNSEEIFQIMDKVSQDKSFYENLKKNASRASHDFSYYDIAAKSIRK